MASNRFVSDIGALYATLGDRHILPFIGKAYQFPNGSAFRTAAIGINSYVSDGDWPKEGTAGRAWFSNWWAAAGADGHSHRFYRAAFKNACELAQCVAGTNAWRHLGCRLAPESKEGLYATNAIKVYTGEDMKRSSAVSAHDIQSHAQIWRKELDLMARHGCLPHLIVVFGRQAWEEHWRAIHPDTFTSGTFEVRSYKPAGTPGSVIYHHANRVILQVGDMQHSLLLVCLHHPSAIVSRSSRRDAAWLVAQPEFGALLNGG